MLAMTRIKYFWSKWYSVSETEPDDTFNDEYDSQDNAVISIDEKELHSMNQPESLDKVDALWPKYETKAHRRFRAIDLLKKKLLVWCYFFRSNYHGCIQTLHLGWNVNGILLLISNDISFNGTIRNWTVISIAQVRLNWKHLLVGWFKRILIMSQHLNDGISATTFQISFGHPTRS